MNIEGLKAIIEEDNLSEYIRFSGAVSSEVFTVGDRIKIAVENKSINILIYFMSDLGMMSLATYHTFCKFNSGLDVGFIEKIMPFIDQRILSIHYLIKYAIGNEGKKKRPKDFIDLCKYALVFVQNPKDFELIRSYIGKSSRIKYDSVI